MAHEVTNEFRETTIVAKFTGEDVPVITAVNGLKFSPTKLVAMWARDNADSWRLIGVELSAVLPRSGMYVVRSFRPDAHDELPDWLRDVMSDITPSEIHEAGSL